MNHLTRPKYLVLKCSGIPGETVSARTGSSTLVPQLSSDIIAHLYHDQPQATAIATPSHDRLRRHLPHPPPAPSGATSIEQSPHCAAAAFRALHRTQRAASDIPTNTQTPYTDSVSTRATVALTTASCFGTDHRCLSSRERTGLIDSQDGCLCEQREQ